MSQGIKDWAFTDLGLPKVTVLDFPPPDFRHLNLLNREERQAYKKIHKGDPLMPKINLLKVVEALDGDDRIIKGKDGQGPPTLKEIVLYALRTPHNSDQQTVLKDKQERYLVLKRLTATDEIELTEGEVKMVSDRIGKMFLQVEIVGRAVELLNGEN